MRFLPRPGTSFRRRDCWFSTVSVSAPNVSTMALAYFSPMPFTTPLERYLTRPSRVAGSEKTHELTRNCRPWSLCISHLPESCTVWPGERPGTVPTAV